MRKRNLNCIFDNIMWYLIYLLPLVAYLILINTTGAMLFADIFSTTGLSVVSGGIVFDTLNQLFGSSGVLPLFADIGIIHYMSYFINIWLIHLAVDFVLFIPRLSHKWLSKLYGGSDD